MAHAHPDAQVAIPRRTRRALTTIAVILGLVTLLGVVLLRSPTDVGRRTGPELGLVSRVYDATVVSTREAP